VRRAYQPGFALTRCVLGSPLYASFTIADALSLPADASWGTMMDRVGGIDRGDAQDHDPYAGDNEGVESPVAIGTDERRMHVRAYNYWVSLLNGRAYPSIEDLDPASIDDFGPNSVLLDFTGGVENPAIAWLGSGLRAECDLDQSIRHIADVPSRSLLSRLTDHYLQIIANRAPIGFEAEFVSQRGINTLYRGILMPFSSDDDTIDFIYGVINWKELVEADLAAELQLEVDQAIRAASRQAAAPAWADGPNARPLPDAANDRRYDDAPGIGADPEGDAGLADWLAAARDTAEIAAHSEGRSRAALYAALGRAYDFALVADRHPDDYAELLDASGLTAQARAPMTPIVKLVFGAAYDKTRLTEYATVLSHARNEGLAQGALAALLTATPGGLKAIVKAERARRVPAGTRDRTEQARHRLRALPAQAVIDIESGSDEFVLLVARRTESGALAVLAPVMGDAALIDRAVRQTGR
jgi:hypothetical protein